VLAIAFLGYRWAWDTSRLEPERGGVHVEAVAGRPQYINPLLAQFNDIDRDLASLVFAGLVRVGPNGQVEGDLAETWEVSPDAKTYTFRLRPDRKWHDDRPVTVEDVLFTVRLLQDPSFPGLPDLARAWNGIKAERIDERSARFTLPAPSVPFLVQASLGILPAHVLGQVKAADLLDHPFNGSPVGAGPYKVQKASVQGVTLVPDPAHPAAKGYLDALEFRFYPSARAALTALTLGEATGARYVPATEVDAMREAEGISVSSVPQYGRAALLFLNVSEAPFDDAKVRGALSLAVDRKALIDQALGAMGEPALGPLGPLSWGYKPPDGNGLDRERAKALLTEAGWLDRNGDGMREKAGKPLAFKLSASDAPERAKVANALAAQLATVGIAVEVETQTWEELRDNRLVPRAFAAALAEVSLPSRDPDVSAFWHSSQADEGLNFSGWRSPRADELLDKGRRTSAAAARQEAYAQFQAHFAAEAPAVFLYYPSYHYALSTNVKGARLAPLLDPTERLRSLESWYVREKRVFFFSS
jgi:peptide/nickel transport system substrate-binding protein